MTQTPDTKPGAYYVSMTDGDRTALLAGPFMNDHAGALAMVEQARNKAYEADPRTHWYSFGTCRLPADDSIPAKPGKLNAELGLPS